MSIVPRYEFIVSDTPPLGQVVPVDNGELCKYADHVVALDDAEQRGYRRGLDLDYDDRIKAAFDYGREHQQERLTNHDMHSGLACLTNYQQGQRDEREACIALVETVAQSGASIDYVEIDSVIAAIRARSDGGES